MGHTSALDAFLNLHKEQLVLSKVPELYWGVLHEKLLNQIFDAGSAFQLLKIDYDNRKRENHEAVWGLQTITDLNKTNPQHIYLIDHAWTFRVNTAIDQLKEFDSLRDRLCNILGIDTNSTLKTTHIIVEEIFNNIWKICNTYSIGNMESVEDRLPIWYVMDEIGSALMHNDKPNCRVVPFFYNAEQITYSLLFPVEDIQSNSMIYCDFAYGIEDEVQRKAALLPWVPNSFHNIKSRPDDPAPDYYLSGHIPESLPLNQTKLIEFKKDNIKVFTEYNLIKQFLTDTRFSFVETEEEADILWYTKHFKTFAELSLETPEKIINQFPYEYVLTVKDLLCLVCRKTLNSLKWLPVTYNLKTEIGNFVKCYQQRDEEGLDNYWIIKPYNLARSLDTHITNNLNYIIRLPATGPKICQKYITKPVLFYRSECIGSVKFDIRYVILLKSVRPLNLYVYKNFFLRFANKPFELNDFHIYEKHFTVMNYTDNVAQMKHMLCDEFLIKWQELYPEYSWDVVEIKIFEMLKEIFQAACLNEPPCGIAENPQSRALYAADIMLEWAGNGEIQPKILEINWTPDCQRACEYYPNFYNDIFKLLFLNEESDEILKL